VRGRSGDPKPARAAVVRGAGRAYDPRSARVAAGSRMGRGGVAKPVRTTVCACLWLVTCAYCTCVSCARTRGCVTRAGMHACVPGVRYLCMRAGLCHALHGLIRGYTPHAVGDDCVGIDCRTKRTDPLDLLCLGRARTTATPTARLHGRTQAGGLAPILPHQNRR